jgi:glutamyl-tRNA synthetase
MLHVGALRDALHKFLLARHEKGQNILRIEDTDRTRYNVESEIEFIETLHWAGIDFDEGPHVGGPHAPYRQSERKAEGIYAHWIQVLMDRGHAYKAFDTPEELTAMREQQTANKLDTGYFGGKWRDATPEMVAEAEAVGKPFVIRQRIPRDTTIVVDDLIRGRIEWDSNNVDDPVLIKGDGMPTYHFAAIVDDHLMGITHTMRGEEWISSAPKHACLFDQFGWERTIFVHCPVIVGNDGKKLSKRHGATRVLDYKAQGYLPSSLKNFIALIGWSPGDEREAMTEQELIDAFSLSGMQPSAGHFDIDKLKWLNGHNIRLMAVNDLVEVVLTYVRDEYVRNYWTNYVEENPQPNKAPIVGLDILRDLDLLADADEEYLTQVIPLLQERVQTLAEFGTASSFFFVDEVQFDMKAVDKWFKQPHVRALFEFVIDQLSFDSVSVESCEALLKGYQVELGFEKLGPIVHPVRVALTGKTFGPGLFELMSVLGPERMKKRFSRALEMIE